MASHCRWSSSDLGGVEGQDGGAANAEDALIGIGEAVAPDLSVDNANAAGEVNSVKDEPRAGEVNSVKDEPRAGEVNSVKDESSAGEVNSVKDEPRAGEVNSVKDEPRAGEVNSVKDEPRAGEVNSVKDEPRAGEVNSVKDEPRAGEVNSARDEPCAGSNVGNGVNTSPFLVGPTLLRRTLTSSRESSDVSDANKAAAATAIYQFHISLCDIKPPIWRRILIPKSYTFDQLHGIIQAAFGWMGHHLHEFRFVGAFGRSRIIISPRSRHEVEDEFMGFGFNDDKEDSRTAKLKNYFCSAGARGKYVYDFGDNWQHLIKLEKILPIEEGKEYPLCIKGKNRAPPEDCGGVVGFDDLVAAYKIPTAQRTAEQKETVDWVETIYENYDPFKFKPDELSLSGLRF